MECLFVVLKVCKFDVVLIVLFWDVLGIVIMEFGDDEFMLVVLMDYDLIY